MYLKQIEFYFIFYLYSVYEISLFNIQLYNNMQMSRSNIIIQNTKGKKTDPVNKR